MLTLADMGRGGLFEMLTSANVFHNHVYLHRKITYLLLNSTKIFSIFGQNVYFL